MMELLFIGILLLILVLTNLIVFKLGRRDRVRRIVYGVIVILFTPLIFKVSLDIIGSFDPGGFASGAISIIYSSLFFINGFIIILIGIVTTSTNKA
jgi:hypothetical protein